MNVMSRYCVSKWDGLNTRRRVRLMKYRKIEELTTRLHRKEQHSKHETKSSV